MKNFMKAYRGQKGFTLIELLVVIIILGVLAAVVTLAVTRFIGKGTLESANAELVTVQAAIESALADGNAVQFDEAVEWTGSEDTSPTITLPDDSTVTAYEMMRTHKLKATYSVALNGDVTDADPDGGSASSGWGSTKITFNTTDQAWEKV